MGQHQMTGRALPDWPAAMSVEMAAAYLGISAGTFRENVAKHVKRLAISPGRFVYRRADLDAYLAGLAGEAQADRPRNSWDVLFPDGSGEAALSEHL